MCTEHATQDSRGILWTLKMNQASSLLQEAQKYSPIPTFKEGEIKASKSRLHNNYDRINLSSAKNWVVDAVLSL